MAGVAIILASFSLLVTALLFQQNREFGEANRVTLCRMEYERIEALEGRREQNRLYFQSHAGKEQTEFNLFIREVSVPQLEMDVTSARAEWPDVCGPQPPSLLAQPAP